MPGSLQPYRAGVWLFGKLVRRRNDARALRFFVFPERGPHALRSEANSGNADVPGQVVVVSRNQVAVVGLWRVGHRKIGLTPVNGRGVVAVEKRLERPILHILGNVVLA